MPNRSNVQGAYSFDIILFFTKPPLLGSMLIKFSFRIQEALYKMGKNEKAGLTLHACCII